jgi:hypothetical protein
VNSKLKGKNMLRIDSFDQLREKVETAGDNPRKPLRCMAPVGMITMIQLRKNYNVETEERYAAAMAAGDVFPAIKGNFDFTVPAIFCYDGEHRLGAVKRNGDTHIIMELTPGSERNAILNAAGVNGTHGLDRTNEDKRSAVEKLLADSEWKTWSSTRIAKLTRTSVPFVEELRQEAERMVEGGKAGPGKPRMRKFERNGKSHIMRASSDESMGGF